MAEEIRKFVDYEELFENALNYRWNGWPNAYNVMKSVEEKGSKSYVYYYSTLKHLLQFLNNYLVEQRVKNKLGLEFNGDDHERFYDKLGDKAPDFIDKDGKTYELKSGRTIEVAARVKNWYDADVRLFYCTGNDILYEYKRDGSFERITELKAPYINIKLYDNIERNILRYWKLK